MEGKFKRGGLERLNAYCRIVCTLMMWLISRIIHWLVLFFSNAWHWSIGPLCCCLMLSQSHPLILMVWCTVFLPLIYILCCYVGWIVQHDTWLLCSTENIRKVLRTTCSGLISVCIRGQKYHSFSLLEHGFLLKTFLLLCCFFSVDTLS